MRKTLIQSICFSLVLGTAAVYASVDQNPVAIVVSDNNNDRQPVKTDDLPEGIRKALATEAYKGWTITETFTVKPAADAVTAEGTAATSFYEISLSKEQEKRTVKMNADGTLLN